MMSALDEAVQVQKAVAHPARLRVLLMLRDGPLCGCQISAITKLAASTVSAHLSVLRGAGLVSERKDGRWVEYSLDQSAETSALLDTIADGVRDDPRIRADAVIGRALRSVSLDQLCRVNLDLEKVGVPCVTAALKETAKILARG